MPPRLPWRPLSFLCRTFTPQCRSYATKKKEIVSKAEQKAYRDSFFPRAIKKRQNLKNIEKNLAVQLGLQGKEQDVPAYPYGPALLYKQSNKGLYGGRRIQYGNNVSERNKIKTRKRWKVNVQEKRWFSDALGQWIRLRVVARVMRTIDKVGGLDNYVTGSSVARIKELGPAGWMLRYRIVRSPRMQRKFRAERERLGLPINGIGTIGLVDPEKEPLSKQMVSVKPSCTVHPFVARLLKRPTRIMKVEQAPVVA